MKQVYIFVAALLFFVSAQASNYFVSNSGNNSNTGLNSLQAWATLQYAADKVTAGDSVFVADGTYEGCYIEVSGTAAKPIVFKAAGKNVVVNQKNSTTNDGINVENCKWIVIDGFRVINQPRAGIRVVKSDNCVVRNNFCDNNERWGILTGFAENIIIEHNECSNSKVEHGIYFSNSADNPIIRYNKSHHNKACGIHMNGDISLGGDGVISNARVEGNIIYENGTGGGSGINCDGVGNSLILNNLLYENHAGGITLYMIDGGAPASNNKIANNTVIQASNGRWCVNITDGSTGNTVLNNILINQHPFRGSITISSNSLTDFSSNNNILINRMSKDGDNSTVTLSAWQSSGYDSNSLLADAPTSIFANPSGADFHLLATSQAIDKGSATVSSFVSNDIEKKNRPQGTAYDIGCYEHSAPNSIHEKFLTQELLVFPNPASDRLMIQASKEASMRLYNVTGELLQTHLLKRGRNEINISALPTGLYFLQTETVCKKLVVQ